MLLKNVEIFRPDSLKRFQRYDFFPLLFDWYISRIIPDNATDQTNWHKSTYFWYDIVLWNYFVSNVLGQWLDTPATKPKKNVKHNVSPILHSIFKVLYNIGDIPVTWIYITVTVQSSNSQADCGPINRRSSSCFVSSDNLFHCLIKFSLNWKYLKPW